MFKEVFLIKLGTNYTDLNNHGISLYIEKTIIQLILLVHKILYDNKDGSYTIKIITTRRSNNINILLILQ